MKFDQLTSLQAAMGAKVIRNRFAELQTRDNDTIAAALCEAFAAMQMHKPARCVSVTTAPDPAKGNIAYSEMSEEIEANATYLEAAVNILCRAVWDKGFNIHHATALLLPQNQEHALTLGSFEDAFDAVFKDLAKYIADEPTERAALRQLLKNARSKGDYSRILRSLELDYEPGYTLIRKPRYFDNKEAESYARFLRSEAQRLISRTGKPGFDNQRAIQYLQVAAALEEFLLSF